MVVIEFIIILYSVNTFNSVSAMQTVMVLEFEIGKNVLIRIYKVYDSC